MHESGLAGLNGRRVVTNARAYCRIGHIAVRRRRDDVCATKRANVAGPKPLLSKEQVRLSAGVPARCKQTGAESGPRGSPCARSDRRETLLSGRDRRTAEGDSERCQYESE
jgi:hypothetical protein